MCFVCTLSVETTKKHRLKTTTKTGMRTRHSSGDEKGDDVFHHQMFF
jgi:hypothetical protein